MRMITASLYWQAPLLLAILVICAEAFLFDASVHKSLREIHLPLVNTLLSVFALTGGINIIGWVAKSKATFTVFGIVSVVSLFAALFIMIWLIPANVRSLLPEESPTNEETRDEAPPDEEKEKREKDHPRKRLNQHRTITTKAVYSLILLLLPVILIVHVQRNSDFYLSNLKDYKAFVVKDLPPDRSPTSNEPNSALAQYIEAPRWSPQNRPMVVGSKPANGPVARDCIVFTLRPHCCPCESGSGVDSSREKFLRLA